ncbi:MAG TPA: hypothetical protein VHA05_03335 [Candidatus Saccharimonadales bacterium]|nr:hypothetical protein [Candidatus Saccharimonadales bacterium]
MRRFADYDIEVPFAPAAGVLNGANEELLEEQIIDVLRSPAAMAIPGSFTWNGGSGNEGTVYYYNKITGQSVNSVGLPNISGPRAAGLYPKWKEIGDFYGTPVMPSVSPGKGEDPAKVLPDMVELFVEAGAPAVEVNYSCPNKIDEHGGREPVLGHDLEQMEEIDAEIVRRVGDAVVISRKLPPYVGEKKMLIPAVGELFVRAGGRKVLDLSNTLGGQQIITERGDPALTVPGNLGGLSGPATSEIGRDQLKRFKDVLAKGIGTISCLGVDNGAEVFHRVDELEADLTCGATVFVENETRGISYGQTCQRIAEEYAEAVEAVA